MERQYIGARYVPRFTGDYDVTQIYEALDVVDNGMGTSYIARKPVPAGTALTNTEYWAIYGAPSGAILDLQRRMNAAESDIDDLEDAVQELSENDNIRKNHILIIGDSYEMVTGFGNTLSGYLGHGSLSLVDSNYCYASGDHYIWKCAKGGSGFTNNGGGKSSGNGFLDRITEAKNAMTTAERDELDTIAIVGGVNDAFYDTDDPDWNLLQTNATAVQTYCETNFPNAAVKVFFIGRVRGTDNPSNITPANVKRTLFHYQGVCGHCGFGFINGAEYTLYQNDAMIGNDNLHPDNNMGAGAAIANAIIEGLITGSIDIHWIPNTFYTLTNLYDGGNKTMTREVSNGVTYVNISDLGLTLTGGVALAFNTAVKIGTQNAFFASEPVRIVFPVLAMVSGNWTVMIAEFKFDGYDVYITNRGTVVAGSGTITCAAVSTQANIKFTVNTLDI